MWLDRYWRAFTPAESMGFAMTNGQFVIPITVYLIMNVDLYGNYGALQRNRRIYLFSVPTLSASSLVSTQSQSCEYVNQKL